jgi:hypothetical protein
MRSLALILLVLAGLLASHIVAGAQEDTSEQVLEDIFLSPQPGQVLQGTILIEGEVRFDGISNATLSFAYMNDPRDTWFLISEVDSQEDFRISVEWDTTRLTDGEYLIKIIAAAGQNEFIDYVPDLRIRNYSAVETNTPSPDSTQATAAVPVETLNITDTETASARISTPMPTNPAQISSADIGLSMGKGVLVAFSILGAVALYQYLRKRRRKYTG